MYSAPFTVEMYSKIQTFSCKPYYHNEILFDHKKNSGASENTRICIESIYKSTFEAVKNI